MPNIVIDGRGSGKTTRLIKRSSEEWIYILTSTRKRAIHIWELTKDMGLDIPAPVTLSDFIQSRGLQGSIIRRRGLLIDDIDDVIAELFTGIPIIEVTMTDNGNIMNVEGDMR